MIGFSKGYGLAGLCLGAIIAPASEDIDAISRMSLAEVAGIAALNTGGQWQWQEAFRSRVKAQCACAVRALNRMPNIHATMPQGKSIV